MPFQNIDPLALCGAITGFSSLGIHFYNAIKDRPRLLIDVVSSLHTCFFASKRNEDNYAAPNRAIIQIRISNNSNKPISIFEFCFETKEHGTFRSNQYSIPNGEYEFDKTSTSCTTVSVKKHQLKPIFELSPYCGLEGFVFFPFLPKVNSDELHGKFFVKTTRGILGEKDIVLSIRHREKREK